MFVITDMTWPQPGCRPSFPKSPLNPLGHFRRLSDNRLQLVWKLGCRNRDLSAPIQEFLKSLVPWVPEDFPYTLSFPFFALQWFSSSVSRSLSLPRPHSNSVGGSCCQPPGLSACFSSSSPSQLILTCFTLPHSGK